MLRSILISALIVALLLAPTAGFCNANKQANLNNKLINACKDANFEQVRGLLAQGANPNYKDQDGMTPLACAAYAPDPVTVQYLLDHGSNPNAVYLDIEPVWMVNLEDPAVVKAMLTHVKDVNVRTKSRWTPLLKAASESIPEVVALLIAHGADVNARTPAGDTAYSLAAKRDDYVCDDIVALLIKAGEKDARPIPKPPDIPISPQSDEAQVAHALLASAPPSKGYAVFQQDSLNGRFLPRGSRSSISGIPSDLLAALRALREPSKVYPAFADIAGIKSARKSDILSAENNGASYLDCLSLPVFDRDHRTALIYASYQSSVADTRFLDGDGVLYLLHQTDQGWAIVKEVVLWET